MILPEWRFLEKHWRLGRSSPESAAFQEGSTGIFIFIHLNG
jgi:hypothetical protein